MPYSNRTKTTVNVDDIPTTTKDMTAMCEWELGDDDPKGTHALANVWGKERRNDMRNPPVYGDIYIDTLIFKGKTVGKQLAEIKGK